MFVERAVHQAELAFLNAPFNPDGWMTAVELLATATGSAVAQLCGGSSSGSGLSFNLFSKDFDDPHGHLTNPLLYGPTNWRFFCRMGGARSIQHEWHYAEYREGRKTGYYDDAVSDLDLPYGCQSPLILEAGGNLIGLALLRSTRDGSCTPDVLHAFTRISHQAHRAVRVQMALGQSQGEDMLQAIVASGEMTLMMDRQGHLLAMTEAAEALFDCINGLRLDGLRVRLAGTGDDQALQAAMGRLLASDGFGGPVLYQGRAGCSADQPEGRWQLFLTRIPAERDVLGMEAQLALTLRPLLTA